MKRKFILLLAAGLCIYSGMKAQQKLKFSSQNYAGFLEGEARTAFQIQSINGFRYKTWFTGIGAGLDYYYQRSIPVFLSFNKFLQSEKVPLYFNADAGINFPWARNYDYVFEYRGDFSPSLYWAGGLGYKFALKKRGEGILLNLAYSYKHLFQDVEYQYECLIPPCPTYKERYDYRLRRLSVKLGWMF
jgi:hypothetical protein